ncbi:hypothetical protein DC429_12295 [Arthrobacter sp. TPD3018]|nr:hypothetical protein DC425_13695 [Sphingomonas sp. TPD3009]PVE56103.1 hypothetical protein DC429_12295 [Arthrobacter sp. TPD3018]PVE81703.1 hypothetical protein DC431_13670 [Sphingomonas melonis]
MSRSVTDTLFDGSTQQDSVARDLDPRIAVRSERYDARRRDASSKCIPTSGPILHAYDDITRS